MSSGHTDAVNYTPGQMRLYLDAIGRDEKRKQRNQLFLLRAAMADENGFKNALESLGE